MKGTTHAPHSLASARKETKREPNGSSHDEVRASISRRAAGIRRPGVSSNGRTSSHVNDTNDAGTRQRRTVTPASGSMPGYSEYLFGPDEVKEDDYIKNPLWSLGEILTMATFVVGVLFIGYMMGRLQ